MKLEAWINEHLGGSKAEFARRLGVSAAAVTRYCQDRIPESRRLTKIAEITDGAVQPNDFFHLAPVKPVRRSPSRKTG